MRKYRVQEPPFSISLELSEGCNLACPFCGIAGIQERPGAGFKFMSEEVIESAMSQVAALDWSARIGFAMRGDPTMHPDYARMVQITTEHRPRSSKLLLTNGGGLLRKPGPAANIEALFGAGLTALGLDHYQNVGFVPKIKRALAQSLGVTELESGMRYTLLGGTEFAFFMYPEDPEGNPHKRHRPGTHTLIEIRDPSWTEKTDKKGNHNRLSNHAGAGAPPNDRMIDKRCALPFRQMAIRWNGDVAACCNDWRGEYKCGNVLREGVEAIWQSNAMGALREMLMQGRAGVTPCEGCDHRSYRNGLLPDLLGKGKVHKPDAQTREHVAEALAGGSYTEPVLRPWEKQS